MANIITNRVPRFRNLRYWAQGGMVHIVNEVTGEFRVESPQDMRERAHAFYREAVRMRQGSGHYQDEMRALLRMAKALIGVVQEAERQGCPLDARAARERHERKRRIVGFVGGQPVPGDPGATPDYVGKPIVGLTGEPQGGVQ